MKVFKTETPNILYRCIFSLCLGIPSIVAFGFFTNWKAAVALILVLWSNNVSQK